MNKFKLTDRGFELTCLMAFRYAVNRHFTQAMGGILVDGENTVQDTILNNLEHINPNFKCQMLQGIFDEYRAYDSLDDEEKKSIYHASPRYLDDMFDALKKDYADHNNGEEWHNGVQTWHSI